MLTKRTQKHELHVHLDSIQSSLHCACRAELRVRCPLLSVHIHLNYTNHVKQKLKYVQVQHHHTSTNLILFQE
jgi:hypothetical protein